MKRPLLLRRMAAPVVLAAVAMVGSACLQGPDPSTSFKSMVDRGRAQTGFASGILPWFCHSEGMGSSMDHSGLANPAYVGKAKGDLSWDDCAAAATFMDTAWAGAKNYPTRGAAKAAGATQSVQFVPGLGTHDMIPGYNALGFDPAHPLFLQYDGMGDNARLAGMSWFVWNGSDTVPPEGLPGNNDWWHTHATLCYSGAGTVIGNEIDDATCTALGGTNRRLPGVWMLHAWIVPGYEDTYDVFASAYMCVKGTNTVVADDPCHSDLGSTTTTTTMPPMVMPTTTMMPMNMP